MIGITLKSRKGLRRFVRGKDKNENTRKTWKYRLSFIIGMIGLVPFLIYYYIRHKIHRIPGGIFD